MSSVCGIINSFLSEKNIPLLKMMAQIDNCAIYADEAKWLLASDSSKQLFVNKNSGVTVAFCGAIYNLDILKQELDCEVQNDADILSHLYCRYGVDFVKKLNGMFTIVLCDKVQNKVYLMRDRLGKKPLFYYINEKQELFFATDLSKLKLADKLEINEMVLGEYLSFQAIYGVDTIYKNVFKLAPASILEVNLNTVSYKIIRYYEPDFVNKSNLSFAESQEVLRNKICEATKRRLVNNESIGVFLSGGVDSSIVTSMVALESQAKEIPVFSIGFANSIYDESMAAAQTIDFLNNKYGTRLKHQVKMVEATDFSVLEKLSKSFGEVFADASMIPTYYLAQFAGENVKVALSGDGGDEFFAGYNRYIVMKYLQSLNKIPLKFRQLFFNNLSKLCRNDNERGVGAKLYRFAKVAAKEVNWQYRTIFDRAPLAIKSKICNFNIAEAENIFDSFSDCHAENIIEKCQEFDQKNYLWSDVFPKVDVTAKMNSLEVRSPLLDNDVIDFANSLPVNYKLHGRDKKYILKKTFADVLPEWVVNGKKKGFAVPLGEFLRGNWREPMREHLLDNKLVQTNLFNRSELQKLIDNDLSIERNSHLIFSLIMLDLFLQS